jgi:hypothetical protein
VEKVRTIKLWKIINSPFKMIIQLLNAMLADSGEQKAIYQLGHYQNDIITVLYDQEHIAAVRENLNIIAAFKASHPQPVGQF